MHCELQGARLPTAEEWLWAASGGAEDRRFPWGNDPLDEHRARAWDQDDYRAKEQRRTQICAENPDHDSCHEQAAYQADLEYCATHDDDRTCSALGRGPMPAPFPWEDGHTETAPADAFPEGAGRWGHLRLLLPIWIVADSSKTYPLSLGRCGPELIPKEDGASPDLHDNPCWTHPSPERAHAANPLRFLGTASIRCASDPKPR